jgi:hypothetical protein
MVYGANLLQRGGVSQYWTWRGDLAATASVVSLRSVRLCSMRLATW